MKEEPKMSLNKQNPRPLENLKVLELGHILAGAFSATILGYFGAHVIKVEPPKLGDPIRTWRTIKDGTSLWWWSLGRNKKSITVNLKSEEGQKIIRDLCKHCDVLIENFRPGQMEDWNLGPEDIKKVNDRIIYTRISGYGQTGPYSKKPGFASVCEGFGGFRYLNGVPGELPVRPNLSLGDTLAGIHAALGVCMAYIRQLENEKESGQVVDVSIFESVFNMLEAVVPEYSGAGEIREPAGTTITGIVPSNTYRCADRKLIIIGANTESMFKRLMYALDRKDLAEDENLSDNAGRVANEQKIDDAISDWTKRTTQKEALTILEDSRVAAGPILNIQDMFEDPHYQARELFEEVSANGEPIKIPAIMPRLERTPGYTDAAGPTLGADTEQVLQEFLSMDEDLIEKLKKQEII